MRLHLILFCALLSGCGAAELPPAAIVRTVVPDYPADQLRPVPVPDRAVVTDADVAALLVDLFDALALANGRLIAAAEFWRCVNGA